jgi:hypothetical protein
MPDPLRKAQDCRLPPLWQPGTSHLYTTPESRVKHRLILFLCLLTGAQVLAQDDPTEPLVIGLRSENAPEKDSSKLKLDLSKPEIELVKAALQQLAGSTDRSAIPMLWNLFNTGNGERRILALRTIGKIGATGQEDDLVRVALGDVFQAVRFAAAEELARTETAEKAATRLNSAAADTKRFTLLGRCRAIMAIGQIGGSAARKLLPAWLANEEVQLACAAAEACGRQTDLDLVPELIKALGRKEEDVRVAVADALDGLTGKKLRFDLVKWQEYERERKDPKFEKPKDTSPSEVPEPLATREIVLREEQVDLVIVFDTTGSMVNIWPEVSNALDGLLGALEKTSNSLRIATIKYRAAEPDGRSRYTILPKPFSRSVQAMRDDLQDASFGGGSGGLHVGLRYAFNGLHWRAQSRKLVIIVGDTSPIGNGLAECMNSIRDAWEMDNILVNTIYVRSVHGEEHRQTYLHMAKAGAGRMYEYNKAERHLVELTAEKVNVKVTELPAEIVEKLRTPRIKK